MRRWIKYIDIKLANLCQAETNQNLTNIQSAFVYNYLNPENTDFLFAKLKGVSNLHIGRATEKGIEWASENTTKLKTWWQ